MNPQERTEWMRKVIGLVFPHRYAHYNVGGYEIESFHGSVIALDNGKALVSTAVPAGLELIYRLAVQAAGKITPTREHLEALGFEYMQKINMARGKAYYYLLNGLEVCIFEGNTVNFASTNSAEDVKLRQVIETIDANLRD